MNKTKTTGCNGCETHSMFIDGTFARVAAASHLPDLPYPDRRTSTAGAGTTTSPKSNAAALQHARIGCTTHGTFMAYTRSVNRLEIHFDVPGIPRPQGSKRGYVNKKTGGVILTESGGQAHKDWRAVVALAAVEAMNGEPPFEGPVAARFTFKLPRPKSHGKKITFPDKRPDLSKLARSVEDSLTHIVFKDDAQIITLNLRKRWAQPDNDYPVGVEIVISKESPE